MNREMPMAARSTSAQFSTCHPHLSTRQREENTHVFTHGTHTRGPSGVFVFLFVSICSESGTWHLWGEQAPPMRPPGLSYVWMQTNAHHGKTIKSKGKHNPWTSQSKMHPRCLLYSHTNTRTRDHSMQPYEYFSTDWIFQKTCFFSVCFFLLFSVRIEIHRGLNWTLSADCRKTP